MKDAINPDHYKSGEVEAIDAIEAATVNKFGINSACVANVIKYLWRYESKNGLEDVKKAKWYFNRLMKANTKQLPTHDQIIESAIVNKPFEEAVIVRFIIRSMLMPEIPTSVESIIEASIKKLETILIEKNNNENIRKNNELEQGDVRVSTEGTENQEGLKESSLQEHVCEPGKHSRLDNASIDRVWNSSNTGSNERGINYEINPH